MSLPSTADMPRQVMTVLGPVTHGNLGITDAHNHVWIEAIPDTAQGSPVLDQFDLILEELVEYHQQGGSAILDCQPGGCGRDGNKLMILSETSGVQLVACTGFHLKKYYPRGYWLWAASSEAIYDHLLFELEQGLVETVHHPSPVKAGFIKIALESTWTECPQAALEAAAAAAVKTRALVEIHTEKGALSEKICIYFTDRGLYPHQLVLCHMDKRPDLHLHKALADFGVLLEYDTFYRPKYNPSTNVWPLMDGMVGAGLFNHIALATDMADSALYRHIGHGPGLASLPGEIQTELLRRGFQEIAVQQMLGGNITRRLAGIN